MGLYTILKKHRLKDRHLRLLFLGLDAAGKSTIVARLLTPDTTQTDALKDISPTLGFKISTIEFENYKLNICTSLHCMLLVLRDIGDVGGQKTLRAYWKNYFEQTDGVIWVVDSTDRERLHDCAIELHNLLKEEVPLYILTTPYINDIIAINGSIITDIGKQTRFTKLHLSPRH